MGREVVRAPPPRRVRRPRSPGTSRCADTRLVPLPPVWRRALSERIGGVNAVVDVVAGPPATPHPRPHPGSVALSGGSSRLSRVGNRQLNAAVHRIAITQAHYHPEAIAFLGRRRAVGDSKLESIRVLKRRLSDVVYRALQADPTHASGQRAVA